MIVVLGLASACGGMGLDEAPAGAQPDAGAPAGFDEWDVLPRVAAQAYAGAGFVRVNAKPYPSDLTGTNINVFVSIEGWYEFLHANPDDVGRGKEVPAGTLIVREVLDEDGAIETLTIMKRAPDGYSPAHGDFWYAVLEPSGFPRFEDGEPLMGRLEARCTGCHDDRAADGFLFGVPLDRRNPALPVPALQTRPEPAIF
jgi:hypothetical protein